MIKYVAVLVLAINISCVAPEQEKKADRASVKAAKVKIQAQYEALDNKFTEIEEVESQLTTKFDQLKTASLSIKDPFDRKVAIELSDSKNLYMSQFINKEIQIVFSKIKLDEYKSFAQDALNGAKTEASISPDNQELLDLVRETDDKFQAIEAKISNIAKLETKFSSGTESKRKGISDTANSKIVKMMRGDDARIQKVIIQNGEARSISDIEKFYIGDDKLKLDEDAVIPDSFAGVIERIDGSDGVKNKASAERTRLEKILADVTNAKSKNATDSIQAKKDLSEAASRLDNFMQQGTNQFLDIANRLDVTELAAKTEAATKFSSGYEARFLDMDTQLTKTEINGLAKINGVLEKMNGFVLSSKIGEIKKIAKDKHDAEIDTARSAIVDTIKPYLVENIKINLSSQVTESDFDSQVVNVNKSLVNEITTPIRKAINTIKSKRINSLKVELNKHVKTYEDEIKDLKSKTMELDFKAQCKKVNETFFPAKGSVIIADCGTLWTSVALEPKKTNEKVEADAGIDAFRKGKKLVIDKTTEESFLAELASFNGLFEVPVDLSAASVPAYTITELSAAVCNILENSEIIKDAKKYKYKELVDKLNIEANSAADLDALSLIKSNISLLNASGNIGINTKISNIVNPLSLKLKSEIKKGGGSYESIREAFERIRVPASAASADYVNNEVTVLANLLESKLKSELKIAVNKASARPATLGTNADKILEMLNDVGAGKKHKLYQAIVDLSEIADSKVDILKNVATPKGNSLEEYYDVLHGDLKIAIFGGKDPKSGVQVLFEKLKTEIDKKLAELQKSASTKLGGISASTAEPVVNAFKLLFWYVLTELDEMKIRITSAKKAEEVKALIDYLDAKDVANFDGFTGIVGTNEFGSDGSSRTAAVRPIVELTQRLQNTIVLNKDKAVNKADLEKLESYLTKFLK